MSYEINATKYLSDTGLEALKRSIRDDKSRNALMIKLTLAVACRANETLGIRVLDLDDKHQTVFIKGLKNSYSGSIPIQKDLYAELKEYIQNNNLGPEDRLFNISYSMFVLVWQFYRPEKKSIKCLRHTGAIELFKRTQNLLLCKVYLRHKSIKSTMVYAEYVYRMTELKKLILK